jgi:hypothetical protein
MGTRPSKQLEDAVELKKKELTDLLDSLRIKHTAPQCGYETTFQTAHGKIPIMWKKVEALEVELQFQVPYERLSLVMYHTDGLFDPCWVPELWNNVETLRFSKEDTTIVLGTSTLQSMEKVLTFLAQKLAKSAH